MRQKSNGKKIMCVYPKKEKKNKFMTKMNFVESMDEEEKKNTEIPYTLQKLSFDYYGDASSP